LAGASGSKYPAASKQLYSSGAGNGSYPRGYGGRGSATPGPGSPGGCGGSSGGGTGPGAGDGSAGGIGIGSGGGLGGGMVRPPQVCTGAASVPGNGKGAVAGRVYRASTAARIRRRLSAGDSA